MRRVRNASAKGEPGRCHHVHELFPHFPKFYSFMAYKLAADSALGDSGNRRSPPSARLWASPSLIDSMRHDTDLDSLRTLPQFQALLAR